MGATKSINMLLNFNKDTPVEVLEQIRSDLYGPESFLSTGYRHPCGAPVIDLYLDPSRPYDYHESDGTIYLRYCNILKDYDNKFENWLQAIAQYVVQVNGHHVGTIYYSGTVSEAKDGDFKLISIENGIVKYIKYTESV